MILLRKTAKIALVFIFLVIIAGSVVRMTGSGMGCPDWPKCFGHYIPPTELDDVLWHKHQDFKKGQMIVHNKLLWSAHEDFTSGEVYNGANWERYTKHDYTVFNAAHTWTEYINRLFGAASGVPVLMLVILSAFYMRQKPLVFILSVATLLMLGYEAWLGKLVVDGNLVPHAITKHMFGSLLIVALLLLIISRLTEGGKREVSKSFKTVLIVLLGLLAVQILLGTQVREQIDEIAKTTSNREVWVGYLDYLALIHRSFSIVITMGAFWLYWKNWKDDTRVHATGWLVIFVILEIIAGIVLYYVAMPAFMQPIHLLLSIIMFAIMIWMVLRAKIMQH